MLVSQILREKGRDVLAISTDEPCVYLDFKKPTQRPLSRVTTHELEGHYQAGHFPASSGSRLRTVGLVSLAWFRVVLDAGA